MKKKIFSISIILLLLLSTMVTMAEQQQKIRPKSRLLIRKLPDLQVSFRCPITIVAGTDIGSKIRLKVWNSGKSLALGTDRAGNKGYMVDLFLSKDKAGPSGWATYSANYSEDVLLKGGRISNTRTLDPGQRKVYPVGGGIPCNTPPGYYYLGAKVDAGNNITEIKEGNNLFFVKVLIKKCKLTVAQIAPRLKIMSAAQVVAGKADLWVEIKVSNISGAYPNAKFEFIVHNTGLKDSEVCDMSVWLYKGAVAPGYHEKFWGFDGTAYPRVPVVAKNGGTHKKTDNYVLNHLGLWTVVAEIDPNYHVTGDKVDESNETNNKKTITFTISAGSNDQD